MKILDIINIDFRNKEKTHVAILANGKVKYLIDINDKNFYNNLIKNQSSYSIKHKLLKKIMKINPLKLRFLFPNIKLCKVELDSKLYKCFEENLANNINAYNYIIGTEGIHQKIVIQIVYEDKNLYAKVGNNNTKKLIHNENLIYNLLKDNDLSFNTPKLIFEGAVEEINISILSEIKGNEIQTEFNDEIFNLYKEISKVNYGMIKEEEGLGIEFSHGDFTPWNIKENNNSYSIYDWEYAGNRFTGYDVIHYIYQVETLLNNVKETEALEKAIEVSKKYINKLNEFDDEFIKLKYIEERKKTYME